MKQVELTLTEEEKSEIEALGGWEKLMETLKARLEEQKGRHQGGAKWLQPRGHPHRPGPNRSAVKVWDQREYRNLDDSVESAHAISRSL